LTRHIGETFHLDRATIETQGTAATAAFVIGKYLWRYRAVRLLFHPSTCAYRGSSTSPSALYVSSPIAKLHWASYPSIYDSLSS
jgi:hypothetical protein